MSTDILIQIGFWTLLVMAIGWPIGFGIAALNIDFLAEFEQEQSDERWERKRY